MMIMNQAIPDPMLTHPYQVVRRSRETQDTYTLVVKPTDGESQAAFEPGQFNMLYAFGIGEVPISISGSPSKDGTLVHTVRDVGAATHAICGLKRGEYLGVRGPYGTHWPVSESYGEDIIIVAGGIGLAPLRPAIYQIIAEREKFGRVTLLYGARTPADMLFTRETEGWRRHNIDIQATVDRGSDDWRGNIGVVTTLIPRAAFDRLNTVAMLCGPEVMMRFTIAELEKADVRDDKIFVSMERNMKCAIGFCGHCQFGPSFICKDGPVFPFSHVKDLFQLREV